MSSIAIGDVHGNLQALDDLLSQVAPNVSARDSVIFLGDYIDRGPDSCRCIDRILRFRQESAATVVTLRGNHEDWLLETQRDYTRHSKREDRKSTRLNSSHSQISYAVFCLKKKKNKKIKIIKIQ